MYIIILYVYVYACALYKNNNKVLYKIKYIKYSKNSDEWR